MNKCFILEFTAPFLRTLPHYPSLPHLAMPFTQIGKNVSPFICAFPGLELCLECLGPPVLMGSLPSIIYGAYQITLSPSPNGNVELVPCPPTMSLENKKFCLQVQDLMHYTIFYNFLLWCSNVCVLYDLNVILQSSNLHYQFLIPVR